MDGQKVPIERRRLRSKNGKEVRLGSYGLFQQRRPLEEEVWWKMLRGLTTRNYPLMTRSFARAYGIEKARDLACAAEVLSYANGRVALFEEPCPEVSQR